MTLWKNYPSAICKMVIQLTSEFSPIRPVDNHLGNLRSNILSESSADHGVPRCLVHGDLEPFLEPTVQRGKNSNEIPGRVYDRSAKVLVTSNDGRLHIESGNLGISTDGGPLNICRFDRDGDDDTNGAHANLLHRPDF